MRIAVWGAWGRDPARVAMSRFWIEAWLPTIRCSGLRTDSVPFPGREQHGVAELHVQLLGPLLVDDRVDPDRLRRVGADVDLGGVLGGPERDLAVLVLEPPAERGRDRHLAAGDPVPGRLDWAVSVGVNRRKLAGSTAATFSARFSITTLPRPNVSTAATF